MNSRFMAIIEQNPRTKVFVGYCPEIPGANGQGKTKAACLKNLTEAIQLILEDRRQDALRGLPKTAIRLPLAV